MRTDFVSVRTAEGMSLCRPPGSETLFPGV